jgi:hypothetical protein
METQSSGNFDIFLVRSGEAEQGNGLVSVFAPDGMGLV